MTRYAYGEADVHHLSSGISESSPKKEEKMVNLGVLFNEARKKYKVQKGNKKNKRHEKQYNYVNCGSNFRKSGILGVAKPCERVYKQGYCFRYSYVNENGKRTSLQRKTFKKLYDAMQSKGFDLIVTDKKKAREFFYANCEDDKEFDFFFRKYCLTEV